MTALSAGQLMKQGEVNAAKAAVGATATTYTPFLAILTAAPTATDTIMTSETEYATATGYARQAYGAGTPSSASPSVVSNSSTITFGPFTSAPGTGTWGVLCDSSSSTTANLYAALLMTTARTPLTGDSLQSAANAFALTLT